MKQAFALCLLLLSLQSFSQHSSLKVVLIRHGEKNDATGNLSCKGLNRALKLPAVLNAKFAKPAEIFVPSLSNGKSTGHARMFQTITPFAVQEGLALNSKYKETDHDSVAKEVMTKKGVILLVWEHTNIPAIAKALGVKHMKLHWGGTDFNSIWIVTYAKNSKGHWEATLTTDTEALNPPDTCNF